MVKKISITDKLTEIISKNTDIIITPRKFRHKVTGEVVTQIPIFHLKDYEEI